MLYLFAGVRRQGDLADWLARLEKDRLVEIFEVDILRGKHLDLSKKKVRENLVLKVREHQYDAVVASPPCATFSRARYSGRAGPPALRSGRWLRGLPHLRGKQKRKVEEANDFIKFVLRACKIESQLGGAILIEHPEDLGARAAGDPGSIWRWPELRQLAAEEGWATGALAQSDWGRAFEKPTRFLTNLEGFLTCLDLGWPSFDAQGKYIGPLKARASSQQLIGSEGGSFATKQAAAWPSELCRKIAELLLAWASKRQRPHRLTASSSGETEYGGGKRVKLNEAENQLEKAANIANKGVDQEIDPVDKEIADGSKEKFKAEDKKGAELDVIGKIGVVKTVRRKITEKDVAELKSGTACPELVYIGRGGRVGLPRSKWANPFKVSGGGARDDVIAKFEDYLKGSWLCKHLGELRGKTLLCHCGSGERCHGDVLIEQLESADLNETDLDGVVDQLPTRITWDDWEELREPLGAEGGWKGKGPARRVKVMGRHRAFHDGGGLCSPGRWAFAKRRLPTRVGGNFFGEMKAVLERSLRCSSGGKEGILDLGLKMAARRVTENPFCKEVHDKVWDILDRNFGTTKVDRVRKEGQCFYLTAIGKLLRLYGDPDWEYPPSLVDGVPVGVDEQMPRTPEVFEAKTSWALDDQHDDPVHLRGNYKSVQGFEKEVEALFEEERNLGWMEALSLEEAQARYGDRLYISSLAVIDEGTKIRVVHDATHGVHLNNRIKVLDQVRYPGAGEVQELLRERRGEGRRGFALLGDASKAHRRVQIVPRDWGLQACRVRDGRVWLNRVGTYGVGSAGYYWTRLGGALHRLGFYAVGDQWSYEALLFADDWLALGGARAEIEDIVAVVLLMTVLGFPWNWKKFRGGDLVAWIGYEIDFSKFCVGISKKRAQWLIDWVDRALKEGFVKVSELEAVVGRLGFAMVPLDFLRPFMAPLYTWIAAVRGAGRLRIPWSIAFVLRFLADELSGTGRMKEVKVLSTDMGEFFRADAKADNGMVSIGGWECRGGMPPKKARWFSIALNKKNAPWAFSRGEPYRAIAALELFATLMCIVLFSDAWPASSSASLRLSGTTDNQGNSWVLSRLMTTKFPLLIVLGELAYQLRGMDLELALNWSPRDQNEEADALTNGDFTAFDEKLRIGTKVEDVNFKILPELVKVSEDLYLAIQEGKKASRLQAGQDSAKKTQPKISLKMRDPWGD